MRARGSGTHAGEEVFFASFFFSKKKMLAWD
jgi:hypothetical protein